MAHKQPREMLETELAQVIQRALGDPDVRAFAIIVGTLLPLTDRQRKRVMTFVVDQVAEELN